MFGQMETKQKSIIHALNGKYVKMSPHHFQNE